MSPCSKEVPMSQGSLWSGYTRVYRGGTHLCVTLDLTKPKAKKSYKGAHYKIFCFGYYITINMQLAMFLSWMQVLDCKQFSFGVIFLDIEESEQFEHKLAQLLTGYSREQHLAAIQVWRIIIINISSWLNQRPIILHNQKGLNKPTSQVFMKKIGNIYTKPLFGKIKFTIYQFHAQINVIFLQFCSQNYKY